MKWTYKERQERLLAKTQCRQKIQYESLLAAQEAVRDLHPGSDLAAYLCPHCHHYHIGHGGGPQPDGMPRSVKEAIQDTYREAREARDRRRAQRKGNR